MFGGTLDLAILSGPWPCSAQSGFGGLVLCGCRCLPVLAGQVLPNRHQHQLGVLVWPARNIRRRGIVA
ncbi:MAG: hypothetical protein GDA36_04665 [Rhodobacteraceae bacterium]|nr:hypothetical protein [Paracoccaceae bacterium]